MTNTRFQCTVVQQQQQQQSQCQQYKMSLTIFANSFDNFDNFKRIK